MAVRPGGLGDVDIYRATRPSETATSRIDASTEPKAASTSSASTSPWTGWMQGALESARRVVREING